jgi:hypothetical protein
MSEVVTLVLHKPTATIQIANQFTLTERKLLNTLVWHSQKKETQLTADERSIPVSQVFDALGWSKSNNTDDLKEALRSLAGTTIEWNEFGVDRVQTWTVCTFLASGKITRGTMHYRLNPEIVNQINRPMLFAKMQLLVQGRFGKRYSLVLYEFFLDEVCRRQEKHIPITGVTLEHLYKLLGVTGKTYNGPSGYKFFNHNILKPSLKEINKHSDLEVHCDPVRQSRRVVALNFDVYRNKTVQLSFERTNPRLQPETTHANDDLVPRLVEHGVTENQARTLCRKYDRERIEGNVMHLINELAAGKRITRRGGWLCRAIEDDYRPKQSPTEDKASRELEDKKEQQRQAERKQQKQAEVTKEFERYRRELVRKKFAAKSKTFQTRRRNEFRKRMEEGGYSALRRQWNKDGFDSPSIDAIFFSELHDDLLTEPHERDFDAYLFWKSGKEQQVA